MRGFKRLNVIFAVMALCLVVGGGRTAQVAAQDDPTATSPIVGVWTTPPTAEASGSITALSSDGIVVDHDTDGTSALGTWEATGATSGTATFVFFMSEPADQFTGTIIVRATLAYDEATDTLTVSYDATGVSPDGTVVFGGGELETLTLTRMPVEGPEMGGQPLDGLVGAPVASPEATPAS